MAPHQNLPLIPERICLEVRRRFGGAAVWAMRGVKRFIPAQMAAAVRFVPEWLVRNDAHATKKAGRSKGGHVGVMVEQSLLDLLSIQMKCEYLSDLRFLTQAQRQYLAHKLECLIPREEDLREWNDALDYLTGAPPEDTAQAAKERLVHLLSQPCSAGIDKAT